MGLKTKLHDNFCLGDFHSRCSQTVGRTDFGRTPLEPALKGQYKFSIVKNRRYANMEQYVKTSMILVFLVHLLRVVWSIFT